MSVGLPIVLRMSPMPPSPLSVLWGKSDAGGSPNLLLQHLFDTAAVAELIWEHYLSPGTRRWLDACSAARGKHLYALLAGLHDVGKASPAFQAKVPDLARRVQDAGLSWKRLDKDSAAWHHTGAGAVILRTVLPQHNWTPQSVDWVWPLIAGHHGLVPEAEKLLVARRLGNAQGRGQEWVAAQRDLVEAVADALGVDLTDIGSLLLPSRGRQLELSGLIIMADWIASSDHFPGIDAFSQVSMDGARQRADEAWRALQLRGGWGDAPYAPALDLIASRFGRTARPLQTAGIHLAEQMTGPGLTIVEAPMGEGKTELALAAAEVLGRRFGRDGVFVGMPTQATSDPMFGRVLDWARELDSAVPVGLLHGKRMFNAQWNDLQQRVHFAGVDEFGCDDGYGLVDAGRWERPEQAPAEWFLGAKRGMLMPVVVGTIDQLLHAATRTKHVMLRHAGLAGRVVILDEIHAYDTYMSQFLLEALRWLGDAEVPVILLSATLPPEQRESLIRAYVQGATRRRTPELPQSASEARYPLITAVSVADGAARREARTAQPWRPSVPVAVDVLDEEPTDDPERLIDLLDERLRDGGCALVIRNTVGRAQKTYQALADRWGTDEVLLLHARLTVAERAARTERALDLLGPPKDSVARPHRLIVVATQLAEQSFDVDADLLVTDLAPIDLLLQRVGRLHRHDRPVSQRPERLRSAQVVVTGIKRQPDAPPAFPRGSEYVYGQYLLLRTAALVVEAADKDGWSVPSDVPALVSQGYNAEAAVPIEWSDALQVAEQAWTSAEAARRAKAKAFLLSGEDQLGAPTLAGLHARATGELQDDDAVAAVVRDGPESLEVVVVRRTAGRYLTLGGRSLGPNGDASDDQLAEEVIGSTVRLPGRPEITAAAKATLAPLPGWYGNPWLQRVRALVLDDTSSAVLAGTRLTYDKQLGLLTEQA